MPTISEKLTNSAKELAELAVMLDASVDCIKVLAVSGIVLRMNRPGCEALGVPVGGPFGMEWLDLLPNEIRSNGRRALRSCAAGKRASFSGMSKLPGEPIVYWDNILTPIFDDDGQIKSILCVSRNITRQRNAERKLLLASDYDALTHIPNRRYLLRTAKKMLKKAERTGGSVGLLIVDLDNLKGINDTKGHDAGDFAIKHVAQAMHRAAGRGRFVGRLGGDEFAVLVAQPESPRHLHDVAAHLVANVGERARYRGELIPTRLSIGGAITSQSIRDTSALFKASDLVLYEAKSAGRGLIRVAT